MTYDQAAIVALTASNELLREEAATLRRALRMALDGWEGDVAQLYTDGPALDMVSARIAKLRRLAK